MLFIGKWALELFQGRFLLMKYARFRSRALSGAQAGASEEVKILPCIMYQDLIEFHFENVMETLYHLERMILRA